MNTILKVPMGLYFVGHPGHVGLFCFSLNSLSATNEEEYRCMCFETLCPGIIM